MKTLITLTLLAVAAVTFGQSKTEFTISLSESSLVIKPGESKEVVVSIVRSKYYAKEKATLGFSSPLPQGVTVNFEPKEGNFETAVARITIAADAPAGVYQLVPSATLNTKRKGAIVKLTVSNDQIAAK